MRPEHHILATELKEMTRDAVCTAPEVSECVRRWTQLGAVDKAIRFLTMNESIAVEARRGVIRSAVVNDPSLVHLFWLLDLDGEVVLPYIQLLRDSTLRSHFPIHSFWSTYIEAIAIFSELPGATYLRPEVKGYEKFLLPYVDFMAGHTSWENFVTEAQTSFAARNRQSRSTDWIGWDGDGKLPTRWDLRFESIKRKRPNR